MDKSDRAESSAKTKAKPVAHLSNRQRKEAKKKERKEVRNEERREPQPQDAAPPPTDVLGALSI